MQNITLCSYIGDDGILHLDLPITAFNTAVEVTLTVKPISIIKPFPTTGLEEGLGCVKYQGPTQSLEDMEQGIVTAARQQWLNEVKR